MKKKNMLLSAADIKKKVERISYEIMEQCCDDEFIVLAGIKQNGLLLAEKICKQLKKISTIPVKTCSIELNKHHPLHETVTCSVTESELKSASVIVVDDVAHTGRTLFYALKPLMHAEVKKIQVAVLIDRKHKLFPVAADYVGMLLSTSMHEHVVVDFSNDETAWLN